jgi:hypothetical protein
MLHQRLEEIPDAIEEVYEKMWQTFDSRNCVYKKEAFESFKFILKEELSLLEYMIRVDQSLQKTYFVDAKRLLPGEIVQKCHDKKQHIQLRTSGFFEISRAIRDSFDKEPFKEPFG